MSKYRPITVHFKDLAEPAIAKNYRKGVYAIGAHFGIHLNSDQKDNHEWPVWWSETQVTPEHEAIAKHVRERL